MMDHLIKKYNIDGIWHFTDRSNIELIKHHGGLVSLAEAKRLGIEIPVTGGNDWSLEADRYKGVHEYVHLSFIDKHPMLYRAKKEERITNPIWLKVDSSILVKEEVRFSPDISNKSGVPILDAEEAKNQIDFEVLFTFMDWRDPEIQNRRQRAEKSEILIPDFVPLKWILGKKNG